MRLKKSTLACVKLLSFIQHHVESHNGNLCFSISASFFEISRSLEATLFFIVVLVKNKREETSACGVINIKKGFYCKLVIKTEAFNARKGGSERFIYHANYAHHHKNTRVIKMLCKKVFHSRK